MKIVWRLLVSVAAAVFFSLIVLTAFWVGRIEGALSPVRQVQIPMCTEFATHLRESPTGYIVGDVPAGSMIWLLKLDLPFAQVAYFNGSSWLEGTVSASVLEVCNGRDE